jgi:hypothetical protein
MTTHERYGALVARVGQLVEVKLRELDQRHPELSGVLADLKAGERLPYDPHGIILGRDSRGLPLALPERPRLEHMHVIGATGSGKTNLLFHMIRQDILLGRGVLVIDPHGNHSDSLYRSLLVWLVEQGFDKSRIIHLIDPNATTHSVGFNPLDCGDSETDFSVIAEAMFEAFERMWGDEDGNTKPTIQRVLTALFTALGEQGMTLAEARLLLDPEDTHGIRALLLQKLQDSYAYDELKWLHDISLERGGRRDFRTEVVGPLNRIAKLVRNEAVRRIVGRTSNLIDLRQAMDEGHIILCNLSGATKVYEQGADLLGRLLTRFMFFHARRRRNTNRTFVAYLDECHRYLSGDIPNIFAEVRKYGVAIVAAHQWLGQLGKPNEPVREAMSKGPNIKVVFRVRDPEEAKQLAEAVIPLNLEMPVQALVKPTVVGHRRTLFRNASTALSQSETLTEGESHSISNSEAYGQNESTTISESVSETDGTTVTDSESESYGSSNGENWSDSDSSGQSSSGSNSRAVSRDPYKYGLDSRPIQSVTKTSQSSDGEDQSTSRAQGGSSGESYAATSGHSVADTHSTTVTNGTAYTSGTSYTQTQGKTDGRSSSVGRTEGRTKSIGYSEGIEPIYENLPSAVHSKDNVLYMAAQKLLSLETGVAWMSYVGRNGRVTTRLQIPELPAAAIDNDGFSVLRTKLFEQSKSAIPMQQAVAMLEQRERNLIAEAKAVGQIEEPTTFRVLVARQGE